MSDTNATFYYFKRSGKFYDSARGIYPDKAFEPCYLGADAARVEILRANHNHCPGIVTTGSTYTILVVPDEDHPVGWPILLPIYPED